ncbi:GNAT family N-acetyltransferase [Paraburkholderia caballeronis]|uniref:ElaA protein n=1 Tax=Paraburkholderia caballeronis TaxID=416943 RepID=A0A1H7MMU0_9BURK|nr:GNAT family N-acetyltransferase [Paraburkholderia caballeronis]PXW26525.1 ElaA protein [Paraburkholderia caballeronis]PXX02072.1 ElaA protein [Paraburkholderia caballeronis]RAK01229.1 ElaA protein [Paraburkholderia caballeronis]SEB90482.1 ElaA protein [Paraburkholderia caballeronis]SEL11995.1 ElaA protein [Paraburkholderia caballeronis]
MNEPTSTPHAMNFDWRWKPFAALDTKEVYELLAARSAVFVVEQNCAYGDIDGLDLDAWHLLAYATSGERAGLAGYLRVLLPDAADADVRIGRVLTTDGFRGIKLGNALLEQALAHIARQWPGVPVRLHAQAHLQRFYGAFGFEPVSDVHDEDGIPHVWMRSIQRTV